MIGSTTLPMSAPYLMTVSPDRHGLDGHLVADGNGRSGLDLDGAVVVEDQRGHVLAGSDAFDHDNRDAVFFFVQYAVDH